MNRRPLPPRGSPLPSRSPRRPFLASPFFSGLAPPGAHSAILPQCRWVREPPPPSRSPPGRPRAAGLCSVLGLAAPTLSPVTWGGGSRPGSSDPAARLLSSPFPLYVFFLFSFFFSLSFLFLLASFLSLPPALSSPSPFATEGGRRRDYFSPGGGISELLDPPTGGDAAPRNGIRRRRRDPRRAERCEAARCARLARSVCVCALSAALRRLRRGSSLLPQGQLAAAHAGQAAVRAVAGGGGAGHGGGVGSQLVLSRLQSAGGSRCCFPGRPRRMRSRPPG